MIHNSKFIILAKRWMAPFIIAVALFAIVRPVLAQTLGIPGVVSVGSESVDGYTQVYYSGGLSKKFITSGNVNSRMPASAGQYVAYVTDINGAGQIFLSNTASDTKTELTFAGTNLNPKVDDGGRVVWEGWTNEKWQIFFFDGKSIRQLTSGDTSINPDMSGDYISYGRRDITGTWRAIVYSIKEDRSVDVTFGEKAKNPKIKDGSIYLAAGSSIEEKFPLSIADLFLLNLTPLTATTSANLATTSAIVAELSATASGVPEAPLASQSAFPTPESSSSGQIVSSPTPSI